jgi:APA family basic amino acid/polyamine antiporter
VPVTPLITVAFCFYLMYSLPLITWIRFGIWMLAGLAIYFLYGVRHSKLQIKRG